MADLDIEDLLQRRVQALRIGVADRVASTGDVRVPATARRALRTSGHFHGLSLLAAAGPREAGIAADGRLSAALAVDYLDAFARTHQRVLRADRSDDGLDTEILAGDLLFSRSHGLVLEVDRSPIVQESCFRILTTAGRRFCEAEARRRELLQRDAVTFARYLNVLEQYGSALSRASTKLGGLLAGRAGSRLERLGAIGRNLGIALTLYAAADRPPTSRSTGVFVATDPGDGCESVRAEDSSSSGGHSSAPRPVDGLPVCIETSHRSTPEIPASTHGFPSATDAFRHRAERRLSAATTHLDALPDTTDPRLFSALCERIRVTYP